MRSLTSIFGPLLVVLLLPTACSDDPNLEPNQGGADAPLSDVDAERWGSVPYAPGAVLRIEGGQQITAGIGTRCWNSGCVELPGPVTNVEPVVIWPGQAFSVVFEAGAPVTTSSGWLPVTSAPTPAGPQGIVWQDLPHQLVAEEPGAPPRELQPGRYILLVQAKWQDRGPVLYGFYIERR